jgi:hypothetical protein
MTTRHLIFTAIFASVSTAQPVISHVSVEPQAKGGLVSQKSDDLASMLTNLTTVNWRPIVIGSWEEQVLMASEHGVGKTLHLGLSDLGPPTISTTSSPDGDVLRGRWDGAPGRPEKVIWLWDTPSLTTFIVEADASLIQPKELAAYCEALFVWNNFIELKSIRLMFSDTEAGPQRVTGAASYLQTSRGIYRLGLRAEAIDGKGYIAVDMSKSLFLYPPDADGVPERFPPLSTRLDGMSRSTLFSELGKGYNSQATLDMYPRNRDTIVMTELLSKGPVSNSELNEIVLGKFGDGKSEHTEIILFRFNALLRALEETKQLAMYLPGLESLLHEAVAPIAGSMSNSITGSFFAAMDKNKVDATSAAFAFLGKGKFVDLSLLYLQQHIHDTATLNKLAQLRVAAEFQDSKDRTVGNVRWRLSSQK